MHRLISFLLQYLKENSVTFISGSLYKSKAKELEMLRALLAAVKSFIRPMLVITVLSSLAYPAATLNKMKLLYMTIIFLLFSKDKTWKKPERDPAGAMILSCSGVKMRTKQIIFVRHGESLWNSTFNKGDRNLGTFILGYIPFLIYSFSIEWYLFITGHSQESWFFDSPLSNKGINQARELRDFLIDIAHGRQKATDEDRNIVNIMLGNTKESESVLISSNLRRAITTCAVAFQYRLEKKIANDDIIISSDLQEVSLNPDSLCITPAKGTVIASFADTSVQEADLEGLYRTRVDTTKYHQGNKALNSNGLLRIQSFVNTIFTSFPNKEYIIVTGHSLWFRSFFRTYLPYDVEHVAKKKKIQNGGVVSFQLNQIINDKNERYWIDENSILVLHGGFGNEKKETKVRQQTRK